MYSKELQQLIEDTDKLIVYFEAIKSKLISNHYTWHTKKAYVNIITNHLNEFRAFITTKLNAVQDEKLIVKFYDKYKYFMKILESIDENLK